MLKVNSKISEGNQQKGYTPVSVTILLTGDPIENLARETLKMLKLFGDVEISGYDRLYNEDIVAHFMKELSSAASPIAQAKALHKKSYSTTVYVATEIIDKINKYLANPNAAPLKPVSEMTAEEKIEEVIKRCIPLLPESVAEQLKALLTPWAIAAMVVVLGIWVAGHFFIASEIADAILLILGGLFLGAAAYQAGIELYYFASKTINGKTETDLNQAAQHLATAISLVGVQVVLGLLLKNVPKAKVFRNTFNDAKPLTFGEVPKLPRTPGKIFYRSKIAPDFSMLEGEGATNPLTGDITYSPRGNPKSVMLAKIHEKVHSTLTPKLQLLREVRIVPRYNSYIKSSIFRYLEEALAETIAQVSVNGLREVMTGITFPVKNGYVTLAEIGTEAKGLFLGSVSVGGISYLVYFNSTEPNSNNWNEFRIKP